MTSAAVLPTFDGGVLVAGFDAKRLLEPFLPKLVVLSASEIPAAVSVQSLGSV